MQYWMKVLTISDKSTASAFTVEKKMEKLDSYKTSKVSSNNTWY
jgi:hypothetical protein